MSDPWLVPFLASLIGGAFVLAGVSVTHRLERKAQEEKENRVIQAFLQGLLVEVESIWQRYQDTMGPQVETLKDGEPLLYYYPVYQDYFSVYHGTSSLIGLIEDDDLRTLIVTTYIKTKGLVDSFRFNNVIFERYENSIMTLALTNNQVYKQKAERELGQMVEYGRTLRQSHMDVKQSVQNLERELRKALK